MRISDWSSDVCSSDLQGLLRLSGGIEASLRLLHVHRIVRRAGWTLAGGGDCVESFGRVLRLGIVSLVRPKQRHDSRAHRSAKRIHCCIHHVLIARWALKENAAGLQKKKRKNKHKE